MFRRNVAVKISENFTMSNGNDNEENIELQERIMSIKNIGYFVYTWHRGIILCTAIAACVMMLATAFLGEWYNAKLMCLGLYFGVAVIIITIALLHIYYRKQYYIEYADGKRILVVGGFHRFRKFYVNSSCYVVKKGQVLKIEYKKIDSIDLLFSEMGESKIVKNILGNKEVYKIKQKEESIITVGLGGGGPVKYGSITFINGKFKNGYYASSFSRSSALHFRVAKDNVKCENIVPQRILNLIDDKLTNND